MNSVVGLAPELRIRSDAHVDMLDLMPPTDEQLDAAVRAIMEFAGQRPTLVCCALGYSRSAVAAAAWLIAADTRRIRRTRSIGCGARGRKSWSGRNSRGAWSNGLNGVSKMGTDPPVPFDCQATAAGCAQAAALRSRTRRRADGLGLDAPARTGSVVGVRLPADLVRGRVSSLRVNIDAASLNCSPSIRPASSMSGWKPQGCARNVSPRTMADRGAGAAVVATLAIAVALQIALLVAALSGRSMIARMIEWLIIVSVRLIVGAQPRWQGCAPSPEQRIYVANHSSHLDAVLPVVDVAGAMRRCTRPVASAEYWTASRVRRYISQCIFRAILVGRGQLNPLERVSSALRHGDSSSCFRRARAPGQTCKH